MKIKNKKKTILLSIIGSLILVLSISYAYFILDEYTESKTKVTVSSYSLDELIFTEGDPLSLVVNQFTLPEGGENLQATTTSSVSLRANNKTHSATEYYDIYLDIDVNEYVYTTDGYLPEIILTITDYNNNAVKHLPGLDYIDEQGFVGFDITSMTEPIMIKEKELINSGSSTTPTIHNWTVTITFMNLDTNQSDNENKTFSANLIIEPSTKFKDLILSNNGGKDYIEGKSHAFNTASTTNDGMYAMADDYGTSYYFRGAIDNNWVKFGKNSSNLDIWWRIVRINGDGSVKLIYTGTTAPTEAQKVVMTGAGTQTETSAFNTSYNSGEYIGYMYTLNEHRGHSTSSTIKTKLDTWYANNLLDYEEYLSDFVVCNDRGFTTDNWTPIGLPSSNMYSDVYRRLRTNNTPQLICPHKEDRYTVKDTIIGNGQLSYPVGLLTADEATLAGGYRTTANSSYYLYTNQYYWLVSPYGVNTNSAREFPLNSSGAVYYDDVDFSYGVRPVISLSGDLFVKGDGTWSAPYQLSNKTFSEKILADNGGKKAIEKKSHVFNKVGNTNEGMYAMKDDYGTSYYFRGITDNNWVKFGVHSNGSPMWWRIVRINGDGSVKLIYTGTTAPTSGQSSVMTGTGTHTETSAFHTTRTRGEYAGFMHTLNEHRGHNVNSTIKGKLDTWYNTNLKEYEDYLSDFITCNDRGFEIDNWTPILLPSATVYSDAYRRVRTNYTPQLICPHKEDAFTANEIVKGNDALTNPIGLLSADEAALAGAYGTTSNSTYYLYTNSGYFLSSPGYASTSYLFGMYITTTGYINPISLATAYGIRPVISLKHNVVYKGEGTYSNPYSIAQPDIVV